ncbi:MAG TPA: hypothetical protein RMH85_07650 [Polyangiaceae bacterium LLY-WYZ-15_(1-7)]|nr:hypothetical protein [Sandaracinus sp.]HJL05719.1 hypothetical protein [Polyangiaceae bacterium LLY-WYZ-15_(1-7)]HJL08355.1 hypothetical protein [Polyangiaceae bacterium LLY-WYZ-15_(1-7)]HJL24524.1 hypothetical protein [Polyangiaceae bacterium LLY-WYZ-15_(1-7)]HJL32207.1 hypothetical protein [Polyangiaceae bacterium LLY-WYZ-15_(1-7)]
MRIGLIGPAEGADEGVLREATEFLLGDAAVDQAIYLGEDGAAEAMATRWAEELAGEDGRDFLSRAAELAVSGSAPEIDALLDADAQLRRLEGLRTLPPPPARAVEMVEDRIVLVVHDKKILDEEDIANATVIVYGRSDAMLLKRFGPRYFFTPGPLAAGKVGLIDAEEDGRIAVAVYAPSGMPLHREVLQGRRTKVSVSG